MRARAVGRKVGGAVPICVEGKLGPHLGTGTFRAQDLSFPRTNSPYEELSFPRGNFRSRDHSFMRITFVPRIIRSRELSATFVPWTFHSEELSFPRPFYKALAMNRRQL